MVRASVGLAEYPDQPRRSFRSAYHDGRGEVGSQSQEGTTAVARRGSVRSAPQRHGCRMTDWLWVGSGGSVCISFRPGASLTG